MLEHEDNINRQILSSQAVKYASNELVCKMRSDMVALTDDLLPYIESRIEHKDLIAIRCLMSMWSYLIGALKNHYYHLLTFVFRHKKTYKVSLISRRDWGVTGKLGRSST